MKSAIIIFPGTNRDSDMVMALEKISGIPPKKVWYDENDLPAVDLFVLAGGFAYGDYLRAGAMAARAPVIPALADRAAKGVAVLGVCNGFPCGEPSSSRFHACQISCDTARCNW